MKFLIYKRFRRYVLIDMNREIVVGTYFKKWQALHAWEVYKVQGKVGTGFDIRKDEEYLIDLIRSVYESTCKTKVKLKRGTNLGSTSIRASEIECSLGR